MKDDVAHIRAVIAPLVEQEEKEVLLVLHSAGAFLGSMAIEGLSEKERKGADKKGGVIKIVFLAGAVWEEGFQHGPLPFFDYQVLCTVLPACLRVFSYVSLMKLPRIRFLYRGQTVVAAIISTNFRSKIVAFIDSTLSTNNMIETLLSKPKGEKIYCHTPTTLLFNDLTPSSATTWSSKLSYQPSSGWDDIVSYTGWKTVPSVYLVCEQDAILNAEMQLQMAERAASKVEKCSAGHCCMIGQPERVVDVVRRAAGEEGL